MTPALHYIQYIAEVLLSNLTTHEEDDANETEEPLRIIICMSKESSRRLLSAQYLQSDIAFKRVAGFLEFEIGGSNQNANIGQSFLLYSHPGSDLICLLCLLYDIHLHP